MAKVMPVLTAVVAVAALWLTSEVGAQAPQLPLSSAAAANGQVEGDAWVLFIENAGQFAEGARFQVRGGEHTM
jgi:hypothetical protein